MSIGLKFNACLDSIQIRFQVQTVIVYRRSDMRWKANSLLCMLTLNDLDGARAEHCGARIYLGNYCFGAEPAAAHSTP